MDAVPPSLKSTGNTIFRIGKRKQNLRLFLTQVDFWRSYCGKVKLRKIGH